MNYTFQFGVAFAQLPGLLQGAIVTFELGLLTFWGGALIGLLGASLKTFGGPVLRRVAIIYVGVAGLVFQALACQKPGLTFLPA